MVEETNKCNKSTIENNKIKKKKCKECKKKLTLLDYPCRCKNFYCKIHRLPENHNCTFDFKTYGQDILSKKNPKIISEKIIKI